MSIKDWFNGLLQSREPEVEQTQTKGSMNETLHYVRDYNLKQWDTSNIDPFTSNYVVNRGITLLADNLAQVPLDIYKGEQKQSVDNPVSRLFLKPNEWTSRFELWESTMIYFYLYGEAFWYLNKNPYGVITEIFVLHPKFMKHYLNKATGRPDKWVFNNKVPMAPEDVIHFRMFNTKGIRGLSPLKAVQLDIDSEFHAAKYNKQFYQNYTKIGGVLTVDKEAQISAEEMRKVVSEWNTLHQGSENAYKVAGLLGGMQYDEKGQTMRDMEFIAGREGIRDRILLLLGIHKAIVGVTESVDRSLMEQGMRSLWQTKLKPDAIRIQEKLNAEFFTVFYPGMWCKFDLTVIEELKRPMNENLDAAKKLLELGYTTNEINEHLGLGMPTIDELETRYSPMALIPLNEVRYPEQDPAPGKELDFSVLEKIVEDKAEEKARRRTTFRQLQSAQERLFHSKMKRYIYEQKKAVLNTLNDKDVLDTAQILGRISTVMSEQDGKLSNVSKPLYKSSAEAGAQYAYMTLGLDKEAIILDEILEGRVNNLKGINDTLFNEVKKTLHEGTVAGESVAQLAKRINQVYKFGESRAKTIARTETASMMSQTTLSTYQQEGVPKKDWISSRDAKTRVEHLDNDNQGAIPVGKAFSNGEQYPGENSINCRCALAPVVE